MAKRAEKHILLVEDNDDIRTIYKTKLELDGYSVVTAVDGKDALTRVREQVPDLILLDIIMPRMDGIEFLKKAGKDPALAHTTIIVMTNLGQDEDRKHCEELGAKKFFTKTEVTIDDLSRIVGEALGV